MIVRDALLIAWIGGAEGFVVKDGEVLYATEPDTLGARLVAEGKLRSEELATFEHADILLNVFGAEPPCVAPRVLACPRVPGAMVVLTTRSPSTTPGALRAESARGLVLAQLSTRNPDYECAAIAARLSDSMSTIQHGLAGTRFW